VLGHVRHRWNILLPRRREEYSTRGIPRPFNAQMQWHDHPSGLIRLSHFSNGIRSFRVIIIDRRLSSQFRVVGASKPTWSASQVESFKKIVSSSFCATLQPSSRLSPQSFPKNRYDTLRNVLSRARTWIHTHTRTLENRTFDLPKRHRRRSLQLYGWCCVSFFTNCYIIRHRIQRWIR